VWRIVCGLIRRHLDGWRADRLAAGDVDPLGDHQKFASVT
jgi:hypothetical protein